MTDKTGNYRGDYEAGGSVQQAFLVGISKIFFWFPAKKTKQNKTKQERKKNVCYPIQKLSENM